MKKKIITLILTLIIFLTCITTYAWYIEKSNIAYVKPTDLDLDINGYYSYTDSNNEAKQEWTSLNETKTSITIEFDYTLNFAFVITNNSDTDIDFSMRLSDFSSYVFDAFDGSTDISSDTKKKIEQYNSKLFLYVEKYKVNDNVSSNYVPTKYNSKEIDEYDSIILNEDNNYSFSDSTSFLWKYGYNQKLNKEAIKIQKDKSIVIYITLKSAQSQTSLNEDYTKWLYDYGKKYIMSLNSSYKNETIQTYLENYYKAERSSLYDEESKSLKPTTLCLEYFEFISAV